jgi:hypothetical protein
LPQRPRCWSIQGLRSSSHRPVKSVLLLFLPPRLPLAAGSPAISGPPDHRHPEPNASLCGSSSNSSYLGRAARKGGRELPGRVPTARFIAQTFAHSASPRSPD